MKITDYWQYFPKFSFFRMMGWKDSILNNRASRDAIENTGLTSNEVDPREYLIGWNKVKEIMKNGREVL